VSDRAEGARGSSTDALALALAAIGISVSVDARDGLVVLRLPPGAPAPRGAARESAVSICRGHGFTHVAVEFEGSDESRASLSRN